MVKAHIRHASVGRTSTPTEVVNHIRRALSCGDFFEDPLRRFEYLRNAKPSSVMIRATPNSVRWDEINRVQYRFQALNFHSDVLEALIHNSPPLSRRERASSSPGKKILQSNSLSNDTTEYEKKDTAVHARVRCIRRSASFDASNPGKDEYLSKRKGSVVQIMKDDTSDYNSDEEVFPKSEHGSLEMINYNATIVHVENRHITDTTEIQVTMTDPDDNSQEEDYLNEPTENTDLLLRKCLSPIVDEMNEVEQCKSAPILSHNDSLSSGYESSTTYAETNIDNEDLDNKSKEELIQLIKKLQGELKETKEAELIETKHPARPKLQLRSPITSTVQTPDENSETGSQERTNEPPQFSVSALVDNFETKSKKTDAHSPGHMSSLASPTGRVRVLSSAFEENVNKPMVPVVTTSRPRPRLKSPMVGGKPFP